MSSRLDISAPPNVRAKTDIDLFSFDAYGFETTLNSPENGIKDDVGTVLLRVRENRPSTFIENATTHGPVTRTTPEAI